MNRNERTVLVILLMLLLLGLLFWRFASGPKSPNLQAPAVVPSSVTVTSPLATSTASVTHMPAPMTQTKKPKSSLPGTTPTGAPIPPKLELHKELIPKDIEIVRCYYSQEIAPPGTTFGFDINGSGFTSEFEKMIKVESGHDHVKIRNLHMITTNQIHGDMDVGAEAKTGFVYPRVLIQGLPVFSAPDPFAVIRKGEVLTVFFVNMEEDGRGGNFRVLTNLDDALAKNFRIDPSTPGIKVSGLTPQLPFIMEGHIQITPGVPPGEHGLVISINDKEVFRRMGMIRVVRPNIGHAGFIQGLIAEDKYHRPGDAIQIYVGGTGLTDQDVASLDAKVEEFDVGQASFTYLSPLQLRLTFNSPASIPAGSYSVRVVNRSGQQLFEKKNLFQIVPGNWIAGVQVTPPVKPGTQSTLKIMGRDFSDDFVAGFHIDVDEPGIAITGLHRSDAATLSADIAVKTGVAPGDYWLHLSEKGQKIDPPFGSIIKVQGL
jgi:hypothetical protein